MFVYGKLQAFHTQTQRQTYKTTDKQMRTRNNNNKKNNDLHIWSPFGEAECRRQMGNVSVLRGQKWTQQKSKAKKKKNDEKLMGC